MENKKSPEGQGEKAVLEELQFCNSLCTKGGAPVLKVMNLLSNKTLYDVFPFS